jgi:hypothetical protein
VLTKQSFKQSFVGSEKRDPSYIRNVVTNLSNAPEEIYGPFPPFSFTVQLFQQQVLPKHPVALFIITIKMNNIVVFIKLAIIKRRCFHLKADSSFAGNAGAILSLPHTPFRRGA